MSSLTYILCTNPISARVFTYRGLCNFSKLLQIVKRLVTLDLQNYHEQWLSCVKQMNTVFDEAERQGFTNLNDWRRHWDVQVGSGCDLVFTYENFILV